MRLKRPTQKYIDEILNKYKPANFSETDGTLSLVFKTFPRNNDYDQILAKVIILNRLYSTNIFNPYVVARHIYKLSIDRELINGEKGVVEKIADVKFGSKKRYLYSFATKYCSWHFPEKYFIYDRYIDTIIWQYKKEFRFYNYRRLEIKDYDKFSIICSNFVHFFKLEELSKKKFDEFLWIESKRFHGEI